MTPAELADELERSTADGWQSGPISLPVQTARLLAAALRGMEATLNAPASQAPDHVWGDYIRARDAALANYRSARERLTGIAP